MVGVRTSHTSLLQMQQHLQVQVQAAEERVPSSSLDLSLNEDVLKVQALSTSLQQHHQTWVQFYVKIFDQVSCHS